MSVNLYGPSGTETDPDILRLILELTAAVKSIQLGFFIAPGAVTDEKVAADAAIAQSKIANLVADLAARATDAELAAETTARVAGDNTRLPLAGGTLTGPLVLPANAAAALQAVPKQQLDSGLATASADLTAEATARATGDNSRLPLAGGTLTGALVLAGDAASALQAVPKQQLDAAVASGVPDATTTVKGKVQLAGDLGGTAAAPTVPGLATEVTARAAGDAAAVQRANHTGTQLAATISDLTEATQDAVGGALIDTATLDLTYNDAAGTISGAVLDSPTVAGATPAQLRDRSTHTGAQAESTVTGLVADLAARALDAAVVHNTGAETIAGVKTFSVAPVVPAAAFPESAVANLTADLAAKLALAGGTMTGAIVLPGDAATALQAVPKQQLDAAVAAATIPDATTTVKGKLQLAGDLAGTAALPTVPGLATKLGLAGGTLTGALTLAADPTANLQAATKQYVDTGVASATIPDATAAVKGKLQLAGDLGGTAALPTVPGLATRALDSAVVHNTGAETVAGVKTFSSAPVVPAASFPESAVANLTTDLAGKLAAVGNATKSGGTLTVDATGSTTTVPLVVTSDPGSTVDHLTLVGPSRGVGAGEYRVIVDRNMGLQTNAAISISTGLWTGTNKEIPAVLAGGRPYCFAADSDIVGPTIWLKGNGSPTSVHVEIQDQPGHKVVEIRQPTGVADGAWMSIGEEGPIATLTLSDKYEEPAGGSPVSFVMRHGRGTGAPASVRFKLPFTGDLDISANSETGENALSEWALRFGHSTQGISFQTAATPGGTRTEMGRFVSNGLLLKAPTATAGIPDRTSPTLTWQDTYWNGSASVTRGFRVKDVALGSGPHALQFIVDETSLVCMAIGYTGQVGVGDPFVTNPGGTGQLHVVAAAAGNPALVTDTATSPTADIQKWRVGSTEFFAVDPAGLPKWTAAGNQQTTVGAAGGASALPATPTKYIKIKDSGGTTLVVPAYAA